MAIFRQGRWKDIWRHRTVTDLSLVMMAKEHMEGKGVKISKNDTMLIWESYIACIRTRLASTGRHNVRKFGSFLVTKHKNRKPTIQERLWLIKLKFTPSAEFMFEINDRPPA